MSTPTSPPPNSTPGVDLSAASAAPPEPGWVARVGDWIEAHVRPELTAARRDIDRALTAARDQAANQGVLADLVVEVVKSVDPAAYPAVAALLPKVEAAAVEAERIAAVLAAVA